MFIRRVVPVLVVTGALLAVSGCTAASDTPGGEDGAGRLDVLASVYPLQYAVEQVGGDLVAVTAATPAGTDPHSVELSPRQLRDVGDADLVVLLGGFQPALDDAVAERAAEVLDVAEAADLRPLPPGAADEHAEEEAEAGDDEHADDATDPHFWLDPMRLAAVGAAVADALAGADPDNAATYATNADAFAADLADLDEDFAAALDGCESDVVVTSHAAFGYLTERYGLRQVSVSGLDPEGEPSPARIREVRDVVAGLGVGVVFTEPLADPAVAATLADGLEVDVLPLDPLDSHDGGDDYREVMLDNLEALRAGLVCP